MPRSVLRLVLTLSLVAAGVGLWLGLAHEPMDESTAIVAAVDRYVAETGGAPQDCVARPGQGVWLEVICTKARYTVSQRGTITRVERPQT